MSQDRLRKLMQDVYESHINFHKELAKGSRWGSNGNERSEIVVARERFHASLDLLFRAYLIPLRTSFRQDALSSVDKVIGFLQIDIPAFRCGYEKEWYLTKLKSVPLTLEQSNRLKKSALDLVSNSHYRRELRDWARLMTILADEPFVASLRTISNSTDHFIQQNARRMLKTVLNNRGDLTAANSSGDV